MPTNDSAANLKDSRVGYLALSNHRGDKSLYSILIQEGVLVKVTKEQVIIGVQ